MQINVKTEKHTDFGKKCQSNIGVPLDKRLSLLISTLILTHSLQSKGWALNGMDLKITSHTAEKAKAIEN